MNNKRSSTLNIIVGILLVGGGITYFFSYSALGALIATFGLLIELAVRYFKS